MLDQQKMLVEADHAGDETTGRQPSRRRAPKRQAPEQQARTRPRSPRGRAAWTTRAGFRPKHGVAGFGILMLLVLFVSVSLSPSTSSGFLAIITNSQNTAGTNSNFSPTLGALPYGDSFPGSTTGNIGGETGWIEYGGTWNTDAAGLYRDTASGSGDKAVTGLPTWGDYTLQADVRVDSGSQAGVLFRVNNPTTGTDALNGYYFGLYPGALGTGLGSKIELGRQNNNYATLNSSTAASVQTATWYHVTVQAVGCTFITSFVPVGSTTTPTSMTTNDPGCALTGAIGLRNLNSPSSFRNVTVTPGGTTTAPTTATAPYNAPFASASTGWAGVSGTYTNTTATESYNETTVGGADDKSLQTRTWGDSTLTGDVQINTVGGTAGFLVRTSSATATAGNFVGYNAAVSSSAISIVRGNGASAPTTLVTTTLPTAIGTAVGAGAWYHLTVEAVGCKITVTGQLKTGSVQTIATATDTGCSTTLNGRVGVRALSTAASWRFVAVTPR